MLTADELKSGPIAFNYAAWQVFLLFLFERYSEAAEICQGLMAAIEASPGNPIWNVIHYFYALSLTALCSDRKNKKKYGKLVAQMHTRIAKWSQTAPMNYQQQALLLSAEMARLSNKREKARILYDESIAAALKNGYVYDVAIANEFAAKFYLEIAAPKIAATYLLEACRTYVSWGAIAKSRQLQAKFGYLLDNFIMSNSPPTPFDTRTSTIVGTATLERYEVQACPASVSTSGLDFDMTAVIKASQALSREIILDKLVSQVMHILMKTSGAEKAILMLVRNSQLCVQAKVSVAQETVQIFDGQPLEMHSRDLCIPIVRYVERSLKEVLLNDAMHEGAFTQDAYIVEHKVFSILCLPLVTHGNLIGMLYLENQLSKGAFTLSRLQIIQLLSTQMAISLENSLFYTQLESKVVERTKALREVQDQLIQKEKMAYLGILTAGIAHEMKNPLNFVLNFSELSGQSIEDLRRFFEDFRPLMDQSKGEDFELMLATLKNNLLSIHAQGKLATSIVNKMLEHTSARPASLEAADIHPLLELAIKKMMEQLKTQAPSCTIACHTDFDQTLPKVRISSDDIYRVFCNILNKALYAVLQKKLSMGGDYIPAIWIRTHSTAKGLEIQIKDNGIGIPSKLAPKIFTPFFTTKPPGQGAGLGLSLSQNIISQNGGTLFFNSKEGEYTEFFIDFEI